MGAVGLTTVLSIALVTAAATRISRLVTGTTPILMQNFVEATSVHWTQDLSQIYVGQKQGTVLLCPNFQASAADCTVTLTIPLIFYYGDHGLTNVWVDTRPGANWLYVTYMMNPDITIRDTCTDYGQMDGRPMDEVNGCPTWGRFSRWPIGPTGVAGPEQILVDGYALNSQGSPIYCAQFSTHSVTAIYQHDINPQWLYFCGGDGAAFTNADFGEMGSQAADENGAIGPCKDNVNFRGAFRTFDPLRLNGKCARIDLSAVGTTGPANWEIISTGHRNPHRLHISNGNVWLGEVGWYSYEELNLLQSGLDDPAGRNFGWPAWEGPYQTVGYGDPDATGNLFHGNAFAEQLAANNGAAITMPYFWYIHPFPTPPVNVMCLTGLLVIDGVAIYCDYLQGICDVVAPIDPTLDFATAAASTNVLNRQATLPGAVFTDTIVMRAQVPFQNPVEIRQLPDGTIAMVLVNQFEPGSSQSWQEIGSIVALNPTNPLMLPSPTVTPAPAALFILPQQTTWIPGSGATLQYDATGTGVGYESREAGSVDWTVYIRTCTDPQLPPNSCVNTLLFNIPQIFNITFTAPASGGILDIGCSYNTGGGVANGGFTVTATDVFQTSPGINCVCTNLYSPQQIAGMDSTSNSATVLPSVIATPTATRKMSAGAPGATTPSATPSASSATLAIVGNSASSTLTKIGGTGGVIGIAIGGAVLLVAISLIIITRARAVGGFAHAPAAAAPTKAHGDHAARAPGPVQACASSHMATAAGTGATGVMRSPAAGGLRPRTPAGSAP